MSCAHVRGRTLASASRALLLLLPLAVSASALADPPPLLYEEIANLPGAGLDYERTPSARNAIFEAIKQQPTYTFEDVLATPLKPRGAPGVALFDADLDGDLDIYVTNGPGSDNSLFFNQLVDSGAVEFLDEAAAVGAALTAQDSGGVCVGDIDNDGDSDLYVLGSMEPNALLENQGDGTFVDITVAAGAGAGSLEAASCSMGDVDGDGLLDIFIGNTFDMTGQVPIFVEPFALNQHNQLLLNQGANTFVEVGESVGLHDTTGFTPPADGSATITWAVLAMDYDQDGDVDLIHADDQAAIPQVTSNRVGSWNRGFIHVFDNDGTGHFVDRITDLDLNSAGQWMGLSAGDVNCDGSLDIFGSNFGDYTALILEPTYPFGLSTSRFFLGLYDGTFADTGNNLVDGASVFGWGTSMLDYDNDGDLDILYHGGLDLGPYVEATNPGVMLENTGYCSSRFVFDPAATSTTDHLRRTVHGVAVGDIDADGFDDIVSVSAFDMPEPIPLVPFGAFRDSVFDIASFVPVFAPTADPEVFVYTGIEMPNGTLSVELAKGNGNGSISVELVGSVGLAPGGASNRDGVGATVSVTPFAGERVSRPVTAGSSYASTDSKILTFGYGDRSVGRVEVLWPGGARNRLYGVLAGEHLVFPEIPCSLDGDWPSVASYASCVHHALDALQSAGVVSFPERLRFGASALVAFFDGAWEPPEFMPCEHWEGCSPAGPVGFWALPEPLSDDDFVDGTPEQIHLGRLLFYDKILSGNLNISCASCHHALQNNGDGLSLGIGEGGRGFSVLRSTGEGVEAVDERIPRNAPSLFNLGALEHVALLHDGRVQFDEREASGFRTPARWQLPIGELDSLLAAQAMVPVTSVAEMAGRFDENPVGFAASNGILTGEDGVWSQLAQRLREIPEYVDLFKAAYPGRITAAEDIEYSDAANALGVYQAKVFRSTGSPFDRFLEGDWRAMSPSQVRGMLLFYGEAGCSGCHSGPLLTDHRFHAIAMPQIGPGNPVQRAVKNGPSDHDDFGRERVSGDPRDRYRFRTPSLRNVALTSPYGHDGAYAFLRDVVEHHLDPIDSLHNYDPSQAVLPSRPDLDAEDFIVVDDPLVLEDLARANELIPVALSQGDVEDLLDFLHALTDPAALNIRHQVPASVPSGLTLRE